MTEMLITDSEQRNNEWCRDRGWRDRADMRRLYAAGSDEEYAAALAAGDARCDCQNPPPTPGAEGVYHVSCACPVHGDGVDYEE